MTVQVILLVPIKVILQEIIQNIYQRPILKYSQR